MGKNNSDAIRYIRRVSVLAMLFLGLAACGGGGDGDGGGEPPPQRFGISGEITAASGSAVDGDTNDPQSPFGANNLPSQAQPLPNPVRLGGYVTATPTGRPGDRFASTPDIRDIYRVGLAAGQRIELTISDWVPGGNVDLDLWLYRADNPNAPEVVDASVGTGPVETLVAPTSGEYWVEVRAFSGGSNYLLGIGDVTSAASAADLRLGAPVIPGEVVVRARPLTVIQRAAGSPEPLTVLTAAGLNLIAGEPERLARLAVSDPGRSLQALDAVTGDALGIMSDAQRRRLDTLLLVKALRNRPDIELAAPNHRLELQRVPNDPGFAQQWHYPLIQLPQAWDLSTGGDGQVIVAVPDTGVFLGHEDLQGQLVPGYDFVAMRAGGDDPGDGAVLGQSSWHGTHIAGTIAARTNNNLGVAGVSWGARIMPLRVLGQGGGTDYDLVQGMRFALGLANDSGTLPERRADIINLSVGTSVQSPLYADVVQAARAAGVILVAAAGNQSTDRPLFPAALDGVLSVTAVGPDKNRAFYANFGPTIDLTAPGGDQRQGTASGVLSTLVEVVGSERRSGYGFLQGTSMSTPHVAGVIALMKAIYPALDYDTFYALLAAGLITEDLGAPGFDDLHGWGLIDALQAVFQAQSLAATGIVPGILIAEPNTLDFGVLTTEHNLTIRRQGDQPVAVSSIATTASWLNVQPLAVDADGLGNYRVAVDRSGLTAANYTAAIRVTSSVGNVSTVPVSMRIEASEPGDVGLIYVLLLDRDFLTVREQALLAADDGRYSFRFDDIEPGEYFLVAGTDNDNDGFICDAGEACGAYPTIGVPDPIRFDRDRADLDFVIGYSTAELRMERIPADPVEEGVRRYRSRTPYGIR